MAVAPALQAEQTPAEQDAAVAAFRESELRSRVWHTGIGGKVLHGFWKSWLGRWFAHRFKDATPEELHGYVFWGPIALAILVTEILGTGWVSSFDSWPTISTTIGHLQDLNSLWGLPVVGLIAIIALYAIAYTPKPRQDEPEFMLRRGRVQLRYGWPLVYGLTALATLIAAALGADRYQIGYVLFGSLALFGIVIPLLLVKLKSKHVVFPNVFFVFHRLRKRFHWLAAGIAAGLAILVIHLALYPWPNLAREPAKFAGITGTNATARAIRALKSDPTAKPNLSYSARTRSVSDGKDAWFIYFNDRSDPNHRYAGCFIIVTNQQATISRDCLTP